MDASDRGRLLNKLADLIERDQAYLAVSSAAFGKKRLRPLRNPYCSSRLESKSMKNVFSIIFNHSTFINLDLLIVGGLLIKCLAEYSEMHMWSCGQIQCFIFDTFINIL